VTGGTTCCPNVSNFPLCRDLQSDASNCGACGNYCRENEVCDAGVCRCGGVVCAAGQGCCLTGGTPTCTDFESSANCGACGAKCGFNEVCDLGGRCLCVYSGEHGVAGAGRVCPVGRFCAQDIAGCKNITKNSCPTMYSASGTFCSGVGIVFCCAECTDGKVAFCTDGGNCAGVGCTPY
jgi:hypothetical protein